MPKTRRKQQEKIVYVYLTSNDGKILSRWTTKELPTNIGYSPSITFKDISGVTVRVSGNYVIEDLRESVPDDYIPFPERIESTSKLSASTKK